MAVDFNFQEYLHSYRLKIEKALEAYLAGDDPKNLYESMRYSVLAGGKRIRAILCIAGADAANKDELKDPALLVLPCACAIEMIHAMSLIHDDLPCMDNDDFRRGKATNHKVFGEAMAMLAGDNLMALAFETLLAHTDRTIKQEALIEVALKLACAIGAQGMVGGQVVDLEVTGSAMDSKDFGAIDLLQRIHKQKTGALITTACWSGARLMNADQPVLDALQRYGEILGLAFQIVDDLLDISGSKEDLGKTPGKDKTAGKLTYVSMFGIEDSKAQLSSLNYEGQVLLDSLGLPNQSIYPLKLLLEYAICRNS